MKKAKLISICGPSGSGKTTFSKSIYDILSKKFKIALINQDNFYHELEKMPLLNNLYNYDDALSFDWKKIKIFLNNLINNESISINKYDHLSSKYKNEKIYYNEKYDLIIFDGIYSLWDEEINAKASLKIFMDIELNECFERRISRDLNDSRDINIESIKNKWVECVIPMFEKYQTYLMQKSDIIVKKMYDNKKMLSIVKIIEELLY